MPRRSASWLVGMGQGQVPIRVLSAIACMRCPSRRSVTLRPAQANPIRCVVTARVTWPSLVTARSSSTAVPGGTTGVPARRCSGGRAGGAPATRAPRIASRPRSCGVSRDATVRMTWPSQLTWTLRSPAQIVTVRPAIASCRPMDWAPERTVSCPLGGTRTSNSTAAPSPRSSTVTGGAVTSTSATNGELVVGVVGSPSTNEAAMLASRSAQVVAGVVVSGQDSGVGSSRVGPFGRNRLAGVAMSSACCGRRPL